MNEEIDKISKESDIISTGDVHDTSTTQNNYSGNGNEGSSSSSGTSTSASSSGAVTTPQSVSQFPDISPESAFIHTESSTDTSSATLSGVTSNESTSVFAQDIESTGIASDTADNIYVGDVKSLTIKVFDSTGTIINEFGRFEGGPYGTPGDITLDSKNNVIAVDRNAHKVLVFDSDGNHINTIGKNTVTPALLESKSFGPDLSFLFIQYAHASEILGCFLELNLGCIDPDGTGPLKSGEGQFYYPFSVTVDREDNIYVTDTANHRVQKFDADGNFLLQFGERGSGDGQFNEPVDITLDKTGNIYVVDKNNHRVQKFDADGNFLVKSGELGSDVGQLQNPFGITVDSNNNVYVTDTFNKRIQILSFENALNSATITFSERFNEIICNTNSMIKDPVHVPPEVTMALLPSELLPRANELAESEQFNESLFLYYIASQIEHDNIHAWNGIGYSQTFLCDNDSPVVAYQNTLHLNQNNVNALNGLGFFYTNQAQQQSKDHVSGDIMQFIASLAVENYEKALEQDEHNVNALNGLGTIHIILEQYDTAIDLFRKSLDIDSDRIVTLNGMALAQLKSKNMVLAESYYDDALNIDRNNFDALSGLLLIYLQQDDTDKVNEMIDRLGQFKEQVVKSLIEQGEWFAERGSTDEAKRFFEKALELDSGNEVVLELLSNIS
ncbi:MAG: 6-bladed beta-propeller [Nitrosopumilus sp.]|nr:6-bladed beta-propeller [Nitrosopumilus sp.]